MQALDKGQSVLTLCREIEHVNTIAQILTDYYGLKEDEAFVKVWRGRDEQLQMFSEGEVNIAIASPVLGEGIDVPGDRIRVLINAEGLMSTIITLQKIGRGQRKKATGSNRLRVIDFADLTHPDLAKHSMKRIEDYEKQGYPIL
jgi:superfamily II DNA or RNA helicase